MQSRSVLTDLETPSLVIDRPVMEQNIQRMSRHIEKLGGTLRPHVKTHKSIEVAKLVEAAGPVQGITVSTLREAEHFFAHGFTDILYAVGISAPKASRAARLAQSGCSLSLIVDSVAAARAMVGQLEGMSHPMRILIELDVDGHRSGVTPDSPVLLEIAELLNYGEPTVLGGVMVHAGGSYDCNDPAALSRRAQEECDGARHAADRLRAAGMPCGIVSVGSSPTAFSYTDLSGITEVRAGVYTFFDLVQAGIGICERSDIALSVLSTVIGLQEEKGWAIVDAGWMALSRDRGTANQDIDFGYGLVVDLDGRDIGDFIIGGTNQEHGIVMARQLTDDIIRPPLVIGDKVRILPNHACSTASQFDHYNVVSGRDCLDVWTRINGW